ncbi:hypothetical protein [Mycolicibacterium elephantis]|uniref:hypothetical protein n=1 Tax=Mycolicibacterium elephantis TaxID=81858 RepID=UPI00105579F8|nr:hypothetical protein [Mycolicibacterium elephantis]
MYSCSACGATIGALVAPFTCPTTGRQGMPRRLLPGRRRTPTPPAVKAMQRGHAIRQSELAAHQRRLKRQRKARRAAAEWWAG